MIANLQAHYGFSRMPFGCDLAPGMLHRHHAHNEAVARINWCVDERSIGVLTGEVGAGKTVAIRTVIAGLDASRHTTIYLPNPMIGVRGIHEAIVTTTGSSPSNLSSRLIAQARAALAPNATNAAAPPYWSSTKPTCSATNNSKRSACYPTNPWTRTHRWRSCSSGNHPCAARPD
jgi:type II secretory pathway predicted ATPase ExeA